MLRFEQRPVGQQIEYQTFGPPSRPNKAFSIAVGNVVGLRIGHVHVDVQVQHISEEGFYFGLIIGLNDEDGSNSSVVSVNDEHLAIDSIVKFCEINVYKCCLSSGDA
jgi:hypothetical protein